MKEKTQMKQCFWLLLRDSGAAEKLYFSMFMPRVFVRLVMNAMNNS